jgi:hypothetical protein
LLGLDARGGSSGAPQIVDCAFLLAALDRHFPAPNIEGATVSDNELRLLQRGNRRHPQNAIVRFPLPYVLAALAAGAPVEALPPSAIDFVDLGLIDGVPLCFTDGASLPDGRMVFSAVAEDTEDPYNDGPCVGAAIGIAAADGQVRFLDRLAQAHKIEGIAARVVGDSIHLLLVTDADDAGVPAGLFSAAIPNTETAR